MQHNTRHSPRVNRWIALAALVAASACNQGGDDAETTAMAPAMAPTGASMPGASTAQGAEPPSAQDPLQVGMDLIRDIIDLPELSKAAVEDVVAIDLSPDGDHGTIDTWFKGTFMEGPFETVLLTQPGPTRGVDQGKGIVELFVRDDVDLLFKNLLDAKLIPNYDGRMLSHPIPDPFYTHQIDYPSNHHARYTFSQQGDRLRSVEIW